MYNIFSLHMKEKLAIFFLCFLVLALCQDGCQQSRLQKIQTGEILLNPNDLGSTGANKNYFESLSRGKFGPTDYLGFAVALAGFETSCSQTFFSLIVDIVQPQSDNTKMKLVIDFRNKDQKVLTTWTKVKLSYLVASAQRYPPGVTDSAYIWATSQYVDLTTAITEDPIFTDPIFTGNNAGDIDGKSKCGLKYDTVSKKYVWGFLCDTVSNALNNAQVSNDIAIHSYIMGFQYERVVSTNNFLAAEVKYTNWMNNNQNKEVAFWNSADSAAQDRDNINTATPNSYGITFEFLTNPDRAGPQFTIANQNNQLKGIKIAIVLTVINPTAGANAKNNGFQATTLSYSYSGIYSPVDPAKFNLRTLIDKNAGYNKLQEKIPSVKYMIYGLSSFVLADNSGCTSFNIDVSIDSVNSYTVSLNQKSFVSNVVVQADLYFPQIQGVCSPQIEFPSLKSLVEAGANAGDAQIISTTVGSELEKARKDIYTNLKYLKVRSLESYQTIPSNNVDQFIKQIGDNPLSLEFTVKSKKDVNEYVRLNAEVVMSGINSGKSYGVHLVFLPWTTRSNQVFPEDTNGGKYTFGVNVNGFSLYQKVLSGAELKTVSGFVSDQAGLQQKFFGVNIVGNTAKFTYNITVPRDSSADGIEQTYRLIVDLFEFQQVYDPITQCCVSKCPAQSGLDVSVTPAACVSCDISKGLTYDPATSSCKCADGFYLNDRLGFQCFPCENKLCAVCSASNPKICTTCLAGASLNFFDNTCSCSQGFFENNGTCNKCLPKCKTCKVASTCDTCADVNRDINNNCSCIAGFYDAGVDKCAQCNPSCATCSSATACVTCDARKFRTLKDSVCVCQDGYFELIFENGTKVCTKCASECKTCSQSAIECTSCDSTINRVQGYDSLGRRTCICKPGYQALADGSCIQSNCKSDKYCSQCEADLALCVQCQANANRVIKLPEHICVCADGFYEAANGTCLACSQGCAKCSSPTKCDACVAQASSNGDGTCRCAAGTFFQISANGVRYCPQCVQYCDRCTNGLTCQTCKSGFILSIDNTCICPKNNFINSKGECVPCKAGCETCFTNSTCDKCISPLVLEQNNCIQKCSSGFFLSGAKCIGCPTNCLACTSTNQCFYCKDGFYLHGGACYNACPAGTVANKDTFQCVPCNSPCKTCSSHPSSCTSCEPGEGYLQISGNDQKCVKECAEGTFPQGGVCQVCDFRCAKCLGAASNCIACPAGRYLYNSACWDYCPGIVNNGSCVNECPAGYWRLSDQECKQCPAQCSTCDSNSTCLTCANNLLSLNGKCVRSCGDGYYAFRGMCVACDRSCKTCANNPTQCTSCAANFISSNGRCVSSCAAGTYLDAVSSTCRICDSSCATCSSEKFCLTCPNDKIIPVGGQCLSCLYPCATCSADLSTCFTCLSGFYMSNGDCVRSCPSGTRPVNGACACSSGLFLDGSCVNSCPSGFTKVGTDCKRCQSPCTECSGTTNFCTDCLDTFTLRPSTGKCDQSSVCNYGQIEDNGKCSRICDAGLYYQNGACIFGGCPDGFKDNGFGGCVSSSVSTGRCESPTFKLNGACTDNCGNGFFPNTNTRNCQACAVNCQNCLNRDYCLTCANGFTAIDGRCVAQSKCLATQFSYNNNCVASCPMGTFTSNGRCVRSCPAGSFYFGGWCYDTCPTEAKYFTENSCVAVCPTGTTLIDNVCAVVV